LKLAISVAFVLVAGISALELSGEWTFESKESRGSISGTLELREVSRDLFVTFWIDGHVLNGKGQTDGKEFTVVLMHSDGSGAGHSERVRLTGALEGDTLSGYFDNGTDRGAWVGVRK
jgi:hypothetical protein